MILRHPNKKILLNWLVGDFVHETIDRHLDNCKRCAVTLERLDTGIDFDISQYLTNALRIPEGFAERLEQKVKARAESQMIFGVMSDIFSAGFETSKLLLEEPDDSK